MPHVEYELAAEYDGQHYLRPGVVCENMAGQGVVLVLGNELLLAVDPRYPRAQRFKVRQHSVDAVGGIVLHLAPPADAWMQMVPDGLRAALEVFVGYVMLDAWIANQDRHHENWGALWDGTALRLAPTFDHGAALARNLLDDEREDRMTSRDRNRTVAAFAAKGRSAFYASPADQRPLELREAFRSFACQVPNAARPWLDRLRAVERDEICGILERVPASRMSEACKRFTLELLLTNQRRLLE
ncbi:MAG: hypothetical protein WD278_02640 [Pirellulales bacterium]